MSRNNPAVNSEQPCMIASIASTPQHFSACESNIDSPTSATACSGQSGRDNGGLARESLTRRSRLARTASRLPLFGLHCLAQFRPRLLKGFLQTVRGLEERIIAGLPGTAADRVPITDACLDGWQVLQAGNPVRRMGEKEVTVSLPSFSTGITPPRR